MKFYIYKYPLQKVESDYYGILQFKVETPKNSRFLSLGKDANNKWCAWYEVNVSQTEKQENRFCAIFTGQSIDCINNELCHVKSVLDGDFMLHWYADLDFL